MKFFFAFVCFVILGLSEQRQIRDVLEQLVQENQGDTLGQLFDVGPDGYENEEEDEQQQVEDTVLNLDQQVLQSQINGINGLQPEDLVRIELQSAECTETEIKRCFKDIGDRLTHKTSDTKPFCDAVQVAIDCVKALADRCAEEEDREKVNNYLKEAKEAYHEMCHTGVDNSIPVEEYYEITEEVIDCLENKIGYRSMLLDCGPVAAALVRQNNEDEPMSRADALCLSYIYLASCTADKADEECDERAAKYVYNGIMNAVSAFPEMSNSDYCIPVRYREENDEQGQEQDNDGLQQIIERQKKKYSAVFAVVVDAIQELFVTHFFFFISVLMKYVFQLKFAKL